MELHDNIGQQLILIKNRSWRLQQLSKEPVKNLISGPINHIATIMAEVRSILHHLRPYQMDLLGLTQSINGLITDTFTDYQLEQGKPMKSTRISIQTSPCTFSGFYNY
ncbi:histidine kinase [Pedobacter steynii]